MELWKDIPGYEGKYQASTYGRIKSLERETLWKSRSGKPFLRKVPSRILKPGQYCKCGHVSVILGRGTPGKPVHQLILLAFIGPPSNGMEVLHNNGNPKDNRLCNLRYGTRRENILDVFYQGKAWRKLCLDDVEAIRFGLFTGITGAELSKMYDVSQNTIGKIKHRKEFGWKK